MKKADVSPCLTCLRSECAEQCEDKRCPQWRRWFIGRWEQLCRYPRQVLERSAPQPVGVVIGGQHYAAPHQVLAYLNTDPCASCECYGSPECKTPCRVRRAWVRARKEALP